jgi:hypothetical protein
MELILFISIHSKAVSVYVWKDADKLQITNLENPVQITLQVDSNLQVNGNISSISH